MKKVFIGLAIVLLLFTGCQTLIDFIPGYELFSRDVTPNNCIASKRVEGYASISLENAYVRLNSIADLDYGAFIPKLGEYKNISHCVIIIHDAYTRQLPDGSLGRVVVVASSKLGPVFVLMRSLPPVVK